MIFYMLNYVYFSSGKENFDVFYMTDPDEMAAYYYGNQTTKKIILDNKNKLQNYSSYLENFEYTNQRIQTPEVKFYGK